MLSHNIQHSIVRVLAKVDGLTFSELRPDLLDNKLFTYHLKIVIREGFVEKSVDGKYRLTPSGQKLWRRMAEKPNVIALRAYSVLFLIIKSPTHGWLLYRRKTHPVIDKVGFMHTTPRAQTSILDGATQDTLEKTGLSCTFSVIGSGFFRMRKGDTIDGFNNFTLLLCESARGILTPNDELADYFWVKDPDFSSPDMLPNMKILVEKYQDNDVPFFIDESVQLGS
jgi:DNA-binding MarR family transcriptional regulator